MIVVEANAKSGALITAILDWSLRERVGFSHIVSLGSMSDVGWGDLIDHLGDDLWDKKLDCVGNYLATSVPICPLGDLAARRTVVAIDGGANIVA